MGIPTAASQKGVTVDKWRKKQQKQNQESTRTCRTAFQTLCPLWVPQGWSSETPPELQAHDVPAYSDILASFCTKLFSCVCGRGFMEPPVQHPCQVYLEISFKIHSLYKVKLGTRPTIHPQGLTNLRTDLSVSVFISAMTSSPASL